MRASEHDSEGTFPVAHEPGRERTGSSGRVSVRARAWRWRALVLVLVLGLVTASVPGAAGGLGYWLMVADPLEPARAIVVLSGRVPFRAMEAASMYRQGWAPEVWVSKPVYTAEEAALDRLGVTIVREEVYNREVLERLGVPTRAIHVLTQGAQNTAQEVRLIAQELERTGGDGVILVTSKPHSRRVRATWSAIVGASPQAIIRYAKEEPYHSGSWWQNTRDALDVSREVFGLMNVWAGFPVQPDRQRR